MSDEIDNETLAKMAHAYEREAASHYGEPDPWIEPGDLDDTDAQAELKRWREERTTAMRAALRAADLVPAQRLRDVMRESDRWAAKYGDAEARAARLEAALQEAMGWNWLDDDCSPPEDVVNQCNEALAPQDATPRATCPLCDGSGREE